MQLVVPKLSEMVVKRFADNVLFFCTIKIVGLHQVVRREPVTFHLLFWVQLVTNSDSKISAVNALDPSFMTFTNKTNVRVLILNEFTLVDVLGVSLPGKHG